MLPLRTCALGVALSGTLIWAYTRPPDLREAELGRADLRGRSFRGANLRDANLGRADLSGADQRASSRVTSSPSSIRACHADPPLGDQVYGTEEVPGV